MTSTELQNLKAEIEDILLEVAESRNIRNYELKPDLNIELGDGFISHFYKGEVINKDSEEIIKVAIKKAPKWGFDFSSVFHSEIVFYSKVLPALKVLQTEANISNPFDNTAEYFASGCDPQKQFIAMEDLKAGGYVLHDKRKYLSKEHLELIFEVYGKFHGLSFVLRKKNHELYQSILPEGRSVFSAFVDDEGFRHGLQAAVMIGVHALDQESLIYEELKDFPDIIGAILKKSLHYQGDYRCIVHGDCWSNNMLFKYSGTGILQDIKLIDFQAIRDSTPIHDLSYFFYSGASKADFDVIEDYLKIYHDSLSKTVADLGEDPEELFPFKTLLEEWKENALMGMMMGLYLWSIKLVPKEDYVDDLKLQADNGKDIMQVYKESFGTLIAEVMNSDVYKEKIKDILVHGFNYGILRKNIIT